jgi:hypothetical protein
MQHLILQTLHDAKAAILFKSQWHGVAGSDDVPGCDAPGWVKHLRNTILIAREVYDMRVSLAFLQQQSGHTRLSPSKALTSAFERAVKTLVNAGWLMARKLIRIEHVRNAESLNLGAIHHLSDGVYTIAGQQNRFVTRPSDLPSRDGKWPGSQAT